ncbi:hypothetical protein SDC9_102164 [bioreactor metagenome]|uniref:Uncharacterized protein n=1 Tax=bioreactor metagenome TaxID=1076179 RepID=A0A645AQK9_9ZZZZ
MALRERETPEGHGAVLPFAEDKGNVQGPGRFMADDESAEGRGGNDIRRVFPHLFRQGFPGESGVPGEAEQQGALHVVAAVISGSEQKMPLQVGPALLHHFPESFKHHLFFQDNPSSTAAAMFLTAAILSGAFTMGRPTTI